jgi:hypothetical protein
MERIQQSTIMGQQNRYYSFVMDYIVVYPKKHISTYRNSMHLVTEKLVLEKTDNTLAYSNF